MCGRYSLTTALDQLLPRLQGALPEGLLQHYAPRRQVRPGEPLLLQRQQRSQPEVALALWGLVPDWCRNPLDRHAPGSQRPINARAETVAEKPFFRGAWRHRRALIPADGFYEWHGERGARRPWLIRRRDRAPFWLGGLWERWVGADGGELDTAVILTTAPNALVAPLHDRMPVLIPDGLEEPWLADQDGPGLRALEPLLSPWDPHGWEALPVVTDGAAGTPGPAPV